MQITVVNIRSYLIYGLFFLLILPVSCSKPDVGGEQSQIAADEISLKYANGFKITEHGSYKLVEIFDTDNQEKVISQFKLFPRSYEGELKKNEIRVPCKRIICLSSTQLAYFIELDAIDRLVALNSSRFLFDEKVNERIKSGAIKRVGKEGNFNVELVAGLDPDLILVSPYKTGGYESLKNLGMPLMPIASYTEKHPRGRAEWIKLIGLLTGKRRSADSIFHSIDSTYAYYLSKVEEINQRPTVFSGRMHSGNWYVPGGESFIAHLIEDAGGEYIFDNNRKGGTPLDFEAVYSKAHQADYWRLQVSKPPRFSLKKFKREDARYADFEAFKRRNILSCNIREKPYYEENPVNPHLILADFIYHFHPELLNNYKPRYYESLE